ncbi:MAG: acyl-CoA dehydrogenase family protein, partial [Gammaproteobacteria bacterium]|nr:acyl-CoA dehydrogenase family protein [Gammaproteobacteria bacterium]
MSDESIVVAVSRWLNENWSPTLSLVEWRNRLVDGGWAAPHWPAEWYGRDYNMQQAALVANVFAEKGVVGAAQTGPRRLAAETILAHGSDDQKQRFLRPILTGEHAWCQLFSEPGSGSDLAGSSTRAERVKDHWVINGQKVWNTSAHHADYGLLLARSDWDLPKHQGLSYFLIDVHQPGVEVRQLKQMNGHASFNEVFITDAIVSHEDLIGGEGNGWAVAATTLSFERRSFAQRRLGGQSKNRVGRVYEEYASELAIDNAPYTWYPQREGRVDLVLSRARESGAISDPVIRQEIARLLSLSKAAQFASASAEAERRAGSNEVIPAGSIGKLAASV